MSEKKQKEIPQVGAIDPSKQNSSILDSPSSEENETETTKAICWFNGSQFGTGAVICSSSRLLKCGGNGNWYHVGRC